MSGLKISISMPTQPKAKELTQEDVWGKFDEKDYTRVSEGMIVVRTDERCPIFKDIVPYKSVTVICDIWQMSEVIYWLEYVDGGNCVSKVKHLKNNKVALRSDYQCW